MRPQIAGLAAAAENAEGVRNLYDVKQRDENLPLAVCLADAGQVKEYCEAGHLPADLLHQLLPGPVTLVLKRKDQSRLAEALNPGVPTLGKPTLPVATCNVFDRCRAVEQEDIFWECDLEVGGLLVTS